MQRRLRNAFLLMLMIAAWAVPATRSVYAIRDAKIYPVSGPMIPRGTVVIRNGLIEAVGANVAIPPEATVIDGTGLTVYPGLIDSFSDTGIPVAGAAAAAAPAGGGRGQRGNNAPQPPQQPQPPLQQQQQAQQPAPQNTHEAIYQTALGLNAQHLLAD